MDILTILETSAAEIRSLRERVAEKSGNTRVIPVAERWARMATTSSEGEESRAQAWVRGETDTWTDDSGKVHGLVLEKPELHEEFSR